MSTTSQRPHALYETLFRSVIRGIDPERAHHRVIDALRLAHAVPGGDLIVRTLLRVPRPAPSLARTVLGVHHPSPFGLAAGFDKDGEAIGGLLALGFGHVEVGTVTPRPQPGNPRKRSFRLVEDRCLINRMGFNNKGAENLAGNLARVRRTEAGQRAVIGVNIGKNKTTALEDAADDYRRCARVLAPYASYLAINVSSPNTPGLRDLQSVEVLRPILEAVLEETERSRRLLGRTVPVLVKIAPDLHDEDIRALARLVRDLDLAGVIATNTTIERPAALRTDRRTIARIGAGGLSGPILAERSEAVLRLLREELPAEVVVISCGGVTTAADVQRRLDRGADLVQGFTGLIYEGPQWPGTIARALAG